VRASDCLNAFSRFVPPADLLLFFLGPGRERLRVSLTSLGDDRITLVFSPATDQAQIRSASTSRGLTGLDGMSHRRQYAAQPFEERREAHPGPRA
jgi:hypothetical protein